MTLDVDVTLGAPLPDFIYATGQVFTSVLVEYVLEPSFLRLQVNLRVLVLVHFLNGPDPLY
jgi:hypothetical protein